MNSEPMRGRIRNRERARQLRDFSGLRFGKITPTDIDCVIEFKDKLFVLVEFKMFGAPMDFGQQLCFERLCNAINSNARHAFAIVAEHDTPIHSDIDAGNATVKQVYKNNKWCELTESCSVADFVNNLYDRYIDTLPGKPL